MRYFVFLLACGASPTPNEPATTQAVGIEGRWTGDLKGTPVRLDLTDTFSLTINQERFEGTYVFTGDALVLNTKTFTYGDTKVDGLCLQGLCAPEQASLPAALTGVLLLDVGPMLPNHPKVELTLTR